MQLTAQALVLAVRLHGEHGAIVRLMTQGHGMVSGYVRGARSSTHRPMLIAGNVVSASLRARTDTQLPSLSVELVQSRGPLLQEPLAAGAIHWVTALTATALPEAQPFPDVHAALAAFLDAVELAPAARGWGMALARYELLMLDRLGFGLDLETCAETGSADNLAYVSPRSGRAVSMAAAKGLEHKLLPLPAFLRNGGAAAMTDVLAALDLSGHFLEQRLFEKHQPSLFAVRSRLMDMLRRAVA